MVSTRKGTSVVRLMRKSGAVLAVLALSLFFAPTQALAGVLTVSTEATVADLFASGIPTPEATLLSVYNEGAAFSGTLDSAIYWDAGKTIAVYTITHDAGSTPLTQFDIRSFGFDPGFNVDNIATAGYITGSPATAAPVTSIDTSSFPSFNLFTANFRWSALDPVNGGDSATVYLTYNGPYDWAAFDGITKSSGTPVPTLGATVLNPEPATSLMLGVGLLGIARYARGKRRKS